MKRMPLNTVREARSSVFPATNNVIVPGRAGVPTASQAPFELIYEDGGVLRVRGPRRERHRRFLDFIFAFASRPIPMSQGKLGFFFDRKEAAKAVFGSSASYLLVSDLAKEMLDIHLDYLRPGFDEKYGRLQSLCADYEPSYKAGLDTKEDGADAMLLLKGLDAKSFEGQAFIVFSELYCDRFLNNINMTMRYHHSLETIFKMDIVSACIARFAISNEYLRARPLNEILDLIGAPTGGTRLRTIAELKSGTEQRLLGALGITIRLHQGQNCVFYDKDASPTLTINARGMLGNAATKRLGQNA